MRLISKAAVVPFALLAAVLLTPAAEAKKIAYPSPEKASFVVEVPDSWKVTPGSEVGDYVTLEGSTGVVVQIRTIEASEDSMKSAITDSIDFVKQTYKDVQLGDPQDAKVNGLDGFSASGTGKDKDGDAMMFVMEWFGLKNNQLAEIWFAASADDKDGVAEAAKIEASLKAP